MLQHDKRVVPAQKHYDWLMKCADDAYWKGDTKTGELREIEASHVKKAIDAGEVWYPMFQDIYGQRLYYGLLYG